ncbi:hypothetical protein P154DRAFT_270782 [Amniculicola lignicola CBS 123094]|uniref:Zn(2)-C6 fungal-type domain-containing protein n=1 Tax=Amniculicola lignicola CBS 123094 TaxID=1392246 RepID=A0A6A5W7P0_9PLEO|nr:hypothetical protein P154DRAFT_270782 [Amniculicola lignicola CBS 123094]
MAIGAERHTRKAASNLDHALLFRPLQSSAMSHNPPVLHSSGVGLPVTDITSTPRSATRFHDEADPATQAQGPPPSLQQPPSSRHRPSKVKVAAEIRRASSTPHMRNLALSTSGELSPTADKRRNKLGYHRTSVACGHCRRRKIRCLVAQDDPQGRCANCIRLKKECNFFPVEQNPETQRPPLGSAADASIGQPDSSTTSSPRHLPPASGDNVDEFRHPFSAGPTAPSAPRYVPPHEVDIDPTHIPTSSGVQLQHPPYAYPHAIETQWPPPTGYLPSSTVAEHSPSSSGYWQPSPSTANSTYGSESNVSGARTPATMSTTSNMSYGGHPDAHAWGQPPPARSMSYGNIEGLPQQYANHRPPLQHPEYPRRTPPYPYPTTIDTNPSTIHTSTLGAHTAPLSAPILPNQQYNYQQHWSPYPPMQSPAHEMPAPGRSMSAQWYSEQAPLDEVQEEPTSQAAYVHHGIQQFYSGP